MQQLPTVTRLIVVLLAVACSERPSEFTGSRACASCHAAQFATWQRSQHAVAMQEARPQTVLGRFDGARLTTRAAGFAFERRGDRFVVRTADQAGKVQDFTVRYTFGVWPLQQYLVDFPGGRLQALSVAWDARPAAAGGQRWFSLQPDEIGEHAAQPRWTGRGYNWNYMCADCHSTGVRKNYDAATDTYHTTRAEINVACEACHGPGSSHAAWGRYPTLARRLFWRDSRLTARLDERAGVHWTRAPNAPTATRSMPRTTNREIETCAQCHARRVHIAEGYAAGAQLPDYYIPAMLTSDLYYPDGQQREEVYTYGSFLQSRMQSAGVTCSDCHDAHSGKLRQPGNTVCAQCHQPATYDTPAHHFHRSASTGARCVSCHMPDTTYMRIDARHDHSIRIPRPDLSVALGVPNACTRCHTNRDAAWAATQLRAWYPKPAPAFQRFAHAFAADDDGLAAAAESLVTVVADSAHPAIVRASALARLSRYAGFAPLDLLRGATVNRDPLVRLGALQTLEGTAPERRIAVAGPLLRDARRAVRQGAAWLLAPGAAQLDSSLRPAFDAAASEFVNSQRYNADQPENRLVLGAFYAQQGKLDSAIVEYRSALRLEPDLVQARVFIAAALRAQRRLRDAITELDVARQRHPTDRGVLLSMATYQAELGDTTAALRTARALAAARPADAQARALVQSLLRGQTRQK